MQDQHFFWPTSHSMQINFPSILNKHASLIRIRGLLALRLVSLLENKLLQLIICRLQIIILDNQIMNARCLRVFQLQLRLRQSFLNRLLFLCSSASQTLL